MKDELLFLYLNGELNHSETLKVEEWIKDNPVHFDKIKCIWQSSAFETQNVKPDIKKAWDNIDPEKNANPITKQNKPIRIYQKLLKYAAAILILVSLGIAGYQTITKQTKPEWMVYNSTKQGTLEVKLPDGSLVTLNKGSQLKYNKTSSDIREVELKGEAFFRVQRNPQRPFLVYSANTVTKVLGTSFNVNAKDTSNSIIVSVKSGKVAFYQDAAKETEKLLLTKGESGSFSVKDKKMDKHITQNENFLAWKTKVLLFDNTKLQEVCKILSQHFNTSVTISHMQLKHQRLTARYQNKSLDEILNSIDVTFDIKHKKNKKNIELMSK